MQRYQPESNEEEKVITIRPRHTRGEGGRHRQQRYTSNGRKSYKGWIKTAPSKQDEINTHPEQIKQKLLEYERIPPSKYDKIDTGTFIRYVRYDKNNRPQLRLGGYLIKNSAPDFWVLKADSRGRRLVTWSVPLKGNEKAGNEYYMKRGILHSKEDRTRYGIEVYDALKSGRYMLVPTETLEAMTGQLLPGRAQPRRAAKTRARFELEDSSNSIDEEEHIRIRARFRDDNDTKNELSESKSGMTLQQGV